MKITFENTEKFIDRHIGPDEQQIREMSEIVRAESIDQLIDETVPKAIRLTAPMQLPEPLSEHQFLQNFKQIAKKNKVFKSYIGTGYYNSITPSVILRNVLENPGWYTAYTPYQAEISQGRLKALLNFQTMVCDLTGMELANASLLDEATSAAEAMTLLFRVREKYKQAANHFLVSDKCFPQTLDVLKSTAEPLGIKLIIENPDNFSTEDEKIFGVLLQYPDSDGVINDYSNLISEANKNHVKTAVIADLLSLTLLTPPGEFGADVVVGTTQRLGIPLGYGGPHAAYFATRETYKREIPGRVIGVTVDATGVPALRMALQTREQHIKRERATSNICTAQVLLAVMAGMYAAWHGPEGLKKIGERIHGFTVFLHHALADLGFVSVGDYFFDTLKIHVGSQKGEIKICAEQAEINFRYFEDDFIGISLDETVTPDDLKTIISVFEQVSGKKSKSDLFQAGFEAKLPDKLIRTSEFLTHEVFHTYHSENEMMRYLKKLENKDLSLVHSMIPLGSCTMKLNAATEMMPLSWPEFAAVHPFVPENQALGYKQIFEELEEYLCTITGFAAASLQPNSGARGEFAGLAVIRAFHLNNKQEQRDTVIIPSSAHGTNPASAVLAGMQVVITKCDEKGNIDLSDLTSKAEQIGDRLAALMITYPSTHGVFEENIREVCEITHRHGGKVYMDGANMNAQLGLTNPAVIGADVCHLNLHKTFCIPHGGGGPGVGPICVTKELAPFLPLHPFIAKDKKEKSVHAVAAAPWGSASILTISYAYIVMSGADGLTRSAKTAILNANYIKSRLENYFPVLYSGTNGRCAHEFIIDCRSFKRTSGIDSEDIAKRLIDYGFHAPTVSFPVPGTLMIEPTESESKKELDRFCEVMIAVRREIKDIEDGLADRIDNVLKNAPHTAEVIISDNWDRSYSREKAAFPLPWVRNNKFWPAVGRVNNAYGDRNTMCTCPPISVYEDFSKQEELVN